MERKLCGRQLRFGEKRGAAVGPTRRGKGTKWMVVVDGQGLPVGKQLASASPHESQLIETTLDQSYAPEKIRRLIYDKAADSNALRERMAARGIDLIAPENRWRSDRAPIEFSRAHLRGLAVAGRLDIDSTGLLVLTQDGRVARQLIGADSTIEKEYLVRVTWPEAPAPGPLSEMVPADRLQLLRHGLALDGVQLKPAKVSWQNEDQLRFALREGRKRQIRRMCEAVGLKVVGLKRVRIGSVVLGALPAGQWRYLRADESF